MLSLIKKFGVVKSLVAATAIGALPTAALAHHVDFLGIGVDVPYVHIHHPVYEDREVRVWIDPVYRTTYDRVWVPDRYEYRDVVSYHHGWRHFDRERVLVEPGHYEDVAHQEVVAPGHWETHIEHVRVG
jgi:hypothetical protein